MTQNDMNFVQEALSMKCSVLLNEIAENNNRKYEAQETTKTTKKGETK